MTEKQAEEEEIGKKKGAKSPIEIDCIVFVVFQNPMI